jgi:signal transduction histidine kinase
LRRNRNSAGSALGNDRARAGEHPRRLAWRWTGKSIPAVYVPVQARQGIVRRWRSLFTDPATWRDLLWATVDPIIGGTVSLISAGLILWGVFGLITPLIWRSLLNAHANTWYAWIHLTSAGAARSALLLGIPFIVIGVAAGPALLRAHSAWTALLLGASERAQLATRVRQLAATRDDTLQAGAAELRRIERDLHDGAQARLVAMGMTLGAAERLIEKNPAAARALLTEAREASSAALAQLRELVRGIHPPVLADRGLGDAIRSLAMDLRMPAEIRIDLPGRFEAPVEAAAYFAVSEILTNTVKHSGAQRVWIDARYDDQMLRISITDDGAGGADPALGTGMRGIERRLAAFDGVLAVSSPAGGPTVVTIELPCVLASPKAAI